jgi:hypothetical protein
MNVRDKLNGILQDDALKIRFGIKFSLKEIVSFKNVCDLMRCVERKIVR